MRRSRRVYRICSKISDINQPSSVEERLSAPHTYNKYHRRDPNRSHNSPRRSKQHLSREATSPQNRPLRWTHNILNLFCRDLLTVPIREPASRHPLCHPVSCIMLRRSRHRNDDRTADLDMKNTILTTKIERFHNGWKRSHNFWFITFSSEI